jgi:hypothetical protein
VDECKPLIGGGASASPAVAAAISRLAERGGEVTADPAARLDAAAAAADAAAVATVGRCRRTLSNPH